VQLSLDLLVTSATQSRSVSTCICTLTVRAMGSASGTTWGQKQDSRTLIRAAYVVEWSLRLIHAPFIIIHAT
jgi:hypothetical protein